MLEGLPIGAVLQASSPWALWILTVTAGTWLIFRGQLVPRSTHQDVIADRDAWREAHRVSEQARIESLQQHGAMVERMETIEQALASLPPAPRSGDIARRGRR